MKPENNFTRLPAYQKGKWFFKVSTLESFSPEETYSVMVSLWNMYKRERMYIRFFVTNEDAAAFVDECVAGKYGDELEPSTD